MLDPAGNCRDLRRVTINNKASNNLGQSILKVMVKSIMKVSLLARSLGKEDVLTGVLY